MTKNINQNPEQKARDNLDKMLIEVDWVVQSKMKVYLSAAKGVALREYHTDVRTADFLLFVDRKPVDWEPADKLLGRIKNGEKVETKKLSHA